MAPLTPDQAYEGLGSFRAGICLLAKALHKFTKLQLDYAAAMSNLGIELRKLSNVDKTSLSESNKSLRNLSGALTSISQHETNTANLIEKECGGILETFVEYDLQEVSELNKRKEKLRADHDTISAKLQAGDKKVTQADLDAITVSLAKVVESFGRKVDQGWQQKDYRVLSTVCKFTEHIFNSQEKVWKIVGQVKEKTDKTAKLLDQSPNKVVKEGHLQRHLQKKTSLGPQRVFLIVKEANVYQYRQHKDFNPHNCLDIVTCNVRGSDDDKLRFEIFSPQLAKSWALEADSEVERNDWVSCIQSAIAGGLNSVRLPAKPKCGSPNNCDSSAGIAVTVAPSLPYLVSLPRPLEDHVIDFLQKLPGNSVCADCGSPAPEWAAINFGILICLECSGVHRAMGTHISKVRSLTLDKWAPELILLMKHCGNARMNEIYEAKMQGVVKPPPNCERTTREQWIKAKYEQKKFVNRDPSLSKADLNKALYKECSTPHNLGSILRLVALCADPNWAFPDDGNRTATMQAAAQGNLLYLECFIHNGGNLTALDHRCWSAAHYAAYFNRPRSLNRILHCAPQLEHQEDASGSSPLDVASKNLAVDVTAFLKSLSPPARLELTPKEVIESDHDENLDASDATLRKMTKVPSRALPQPPPKKPPTTPPQSPSPPAPSASAALGSASAQQHSHSAVELRGPSPCAATATPPLLTNIDPALLGVTESSGAPTTSGITIGSRVRGRQ
eukprot:TRINITY_DN611_c0_g2_i1.p1 TRINITY_DN611_c0_g2~~TRINITY_DN611_c0_g2_i1.p1  ORF type:complete len:770 (-),score=204.10 TRINITY_DN611_c0_g2_i1:78-2270(-)